MKNILKSVFSLKSLLSLCLVVLAYFVCQATGADASTTIMAASCMPFATHDADLNDFFAAVINPMGIKTPIVEDAELLLGVRLDKNKSQLVFNVIDSSTKLPYERRLLEQDVFRITHIAGEIIKVDETLGSENYSVTPYTYPDPSVFVGVKATKKETDAIEAIYSGVINFTRSRTGLLKDFPTRSLAFAPERQKSDGTYYPTINDDRYKRLTIQPVISGKDSMEFKLDLGTTTAAYMELLQGDINAAGATITTARNHFVLRLRGFRAVGIGVEFAQWRKRYNESLGIRE